MDVVTKGNLHLELHGNPTFTLTCAMEQNRKYSSDFKVSTRPADVGKDAFSQRAPSFKENKLLRPLCMPRWKTGLLRDEDTNHRKWCQEGKVTSVSRDNKESGCGGGEDVFGICGGSDERAEAAQGSDAAWGSPGLPRLQV